MEKRKLEKLGIETSLLGFGCMRFPTTPDGKIDEAEAERMMDKAIASGVNYIDTAYPYHNGESEPLVVKVLKKYDRSSFYLATKLPLWAVKSVDDAKRIFEEQLQRLQTDYIDFYLLHAVNKEKWEEMKALGVVDYCAKLKEEGKLVIVSTHIMSEAEKLCDRIGIIIDGKKRAEGTLQELLDETRTQDLEDAFFQYFKSVKGEA